MTEQATARRAANNNTSVRQSVAALTRLSDRLATVNPPPVAAALAAPAPAAPTVGAVARPLAGTERKPHRSPSIAAAIVRGFVAASSFIPYALVALVLRLAVARVFFLDGQTRVDGLSIPFGLHGYDFSFVLPLQLKSLSYTSFLTGYLPLPPGFAAYVVSGAEFVLPIMLVLGLGTRFAALGLLIVTALMQIHEMPQALLSLHVYGASILLVLMACGPGRVSLDHLIKLANSKGSRR